MHLTDFIEYMNREVGQKPLAKLDTEAYGKAMAQSLHRHYIEDRQRGGVRASNLGKPATLLALAKLGYVEPEPKGKSRLIFHMGDVFENFLEHMLAQYGIEILESQTEIGWTSPSGLSVSGHLDYVIKSPVTGKPIVLEAKTMSANYARMFRRNQDDDRGYVTQLSLYATAKGMDATWVCMDKGNADLFEIPLLPGLMIPALDRGTQVLDRVAKVESVGDILKVFRAPPVKAEKYKGSATGRYLLPVTFKMSPFRKVLYKTSIDTNGYGKETEYVDDFADTEHMQRMLDELVESGEIKYAS